MTQIITTEADYIDVATYSTGISIKIYGGEGNTHYRVDVVLTPRFAALMEKEIHRAIRQHQELWPGADINDGN